MCSWKSDMENHQNWIPDWQEEEQRDCQHLGKVTELLKKKKSGCPAIPPLQCSAPRCQQQCTYRVWGAVLNARYMFSDFSGAWCQVSFLFLPCQIHSPPISTPISVPEEVVGWQMFNKRISNKKALACHICWCLWYRLSLASYYQHDVKLVPRTLRWGQLGLPYGEYYTESCREGGELSAEASSLLVGPLT